MTPGILPAAYALLRDASSAAHRGLCPRVQLLRFGAEWVFAICEAREVEVVILNQGEDTTFEEDLAKDVLEIITVFSARLYGSRSRKQKGSSNRNNIVDPDI